MAVDADGGLDGLVAEMLLDDRKGTPAAIIHDAEVWRRSCTRGDLVNPAIMALSRPGFIPRVRLLCAHGVARAIGE